MQEGLGLNKNLRVFIAPIRSGSTPLLHCFANNKNVRRCIYQPVKTGIRKGEGPDFRLFFDNSSLDNLAEETRRMIIDVSKETLGPYSPDEARYPLFPFSEDARHIRQTKPVFLFRDILESFSSAVARKWHWHVQLRDKDGRICKPEEDNEEARIKRFIELQRLAYRTLFNAYDYARQVAPEDVLCVTYKQICEKPEQVFKIICRHWGIHFDKNMLDWKISFEEAISGDNPRIVGGKDFYDLYDSGAFEGITSATTFQAVRRSIITSPEIIRALRVTGEMGDLYAQAEEQAAIDCGIRTENCYLLK